MLNNVWSRFSILFIYLFLLYFSLVPQLLVAYSGFVYSGTVGIRDALLMTLIWLLPVVVWPSQAKVISGVIGVILCLCSLAPFGYWLIYRQDFSQSVVFIIMESNGVEAAEFISSYMRWWYPLAYLLFVVPPFLFWAKITNPQPRYLVRTVIAMISISVVLVPFAKTARSSGIDEGWLHLGERLELNQPWNIIFNVVKYRQQLAQVQALVDGAREAKPLVGLTEKNSGMAKTMVLVIGESHNRQRMSLYGYGRPTTPLLDAMHSNEPESLYVFNDVVTPRPHTMGALEQALTFADSKNMSLFCKKPNLIQMMKQAGYHITWINNQQTQASSDTVQSMFSLFADEQIYLNNMRRWSSNQYDQVVFEPFSKTLAEDKSQKRLIVIHLLGLHRRYRYRYPEEYQQFKERDDKIPAWVPESELKTYNSYDNATLYNDMVVTSIINRLRSATEGDKGRDQESAMLVYFADHGEDVFDFFEQPFVNRSEVTPTPAMYTVPLIIWVNNTYRKHNNTGRWKNYTSRSFSTADFIYTWADLVGLDFDSMDSSRSLVSEQYRPHPRWIGAPGEPNKLRDYSDFLKEYMDRKRL